MVGEYEEGQLAFQKNTADNNFCRPFSWYINCDTADPKYVGEQREQVLNLNELKKPRVSSRLSTDLFWRLLDSVQPVNNDLYSHKKSQFQTESPQTYSVRNIQFKVEEKYLQNEVGTLRLKCTASINNVYWRSTEIKIYPVKANKIYSRFHGKAGKGVAVPAFDHFVLLLSIKLVV